MSNDQNPYQEHQQLHQHNPPQPTRLTHPFTHLLHTHTLSPLTDLPVTQRLTPPERVALLKVHVLIRMFDRCIQDPCWAEWRSEVQRIRGELVVGVGYRARDGDEVMRMFEKACDAWRVVEWEEKIRRRRERREREGGGGREEEENVKREENVASDVETDDKIVEEEPRTTTGISVNPNATKSFRERVNDALMEGRMKYAPGLYVSDDEGEIEIEVVQE